MPIEPSPLSAALVRAQSSTAVVRKDAYEPFNKYRYASSEAVIGDARGILSSAGLALITTGWSIVESTVVVSYRLLHTSGESLDLSAATYIVAASTSGKGRPPDKALFGALTESLAYTLRGLLLLPRGDDELADAVAAAPAALAPSLAALTPGPAPEPQLTAPASDSNMLDALLNEARAEVALAADKERIGQIFAMYGEGVGDARAVELRVACAERAFAIATTPTELDAWVPRIQSWQLPADALARTRAAYSARYDRLMSEIPT